MSLPQIPRQLSLPQIGGWPFLITSFFGRLPNAMVQLGYLMILSQGGRGLAAGGLAVAAVGLGSALFGPFVGRLVDRYGPLRILSSALLFSLVGQGLFLFSISSGQPTWKLLSFAFLVGSANPQVGPVARSYWSHLARTQNQPRLVVRALGYEGAVDEVSFVVGPMLSGFLVNYLGAIPAGLTIMGLTAVLMTVFLFHLLRTRAVWADHRDHHQDIAVSSSHIPLAALWPMLACLGIGIIFGSTQTGLTAMFTARDSAGYAGLVYGAVGIGSGAASIFVGKLARWFGIPTRVASGSLLLGLAGLLFMTLPNLSIAITTAIALGTGAGISLVSSFDWMERCAPSHLVATMMTLLATCITLGVSVGAAVAGYLAANPAHAFSLILIAGALGLSASVGMRFLSSNTGS